MSNHPFTAEQVQAALADPESTQVQYDLKCMNKHRDGANMGRDGFQFTGIWSILLLNVNIVHRITVIAYTRDIADKWIDQKLTYISELLHKLAHYRLHYNGGMSFEDFYLTETNDHLNLWIDKSGDHGHTRLAPPGISPSPGIETKAGYPYHIYCPWKEKFVQEDNYNITDEDALLEENEFKKRPKPPPLPALDMSGKKPGEEGYKEYIAELVDFAIMYINIKEFMARSGYDSAKSWATNNLADQCELYRRKNCFGRH